MQRHTFPAASHLHSLYANIPHAPHPNKAGLQPALKQIYRFCPPLAESTACTRVMNERKLEGRVVYNK